MPDHLYIVGMTKSGKSLWAKALSCATTRRGVGVLVFDPKAPYSGRNVAGWTGYVFNGADWERFVATVRGSRCCLVVIDEAGEVFRGHADVLVPMMTGGRHVLAGSGGHCFCLLAQRHKLFNKTARDQCDRIVCFRINRDDAAELALDCNSDALAQAHLLPKLHFLMVDLPDGQPIRGVVPLPG